MEGGEYQLVARGRARQRQRSVHESRATTPMVRENGPALQPRPLRTPSCRACLQTPSPPRPARRLTHVTPQLVTGESIFSFIALNPRGLNPQS